MHIRIALLVTLFAALLTASCTGGQASKAELDAARQARERERTGALAMANALPDCKTWCDPDKPDYRCFFAGSIEGRDAQLKGLAARLGRAQPVEVPQTELVKIFELEGQGLENVRGPTSVHSDVLQNAGAESTLTTKTKDGLAVTVNVPGSMEYKYQKRSTGFELREVAAARSFHLKINDSILDATYGGRILGIDVEGPAARFYTQNGCIFYDTRANLAGGEVVRRYNAILQRRLLVENLIGSDATRTSKVRISYARTAGLATAICAKCEKCSAGEIPCKFMSQQECMSREDCKEAGGEECSD